MTVTYLLLCALALGLVVLLWDLGRRRAAADKKARQLEPYAQLGEGIEGVAHDAGNLLRAARITVEQLDLLDHGDADVARLARQAERQLCEAEHFLRVLGQQPDAPQEVDAIACLRLVIALLEDKRKIDRSELVGQLPVHAAPRALSRLLGNLLTNALQHADRLRVGRAERQLFVENPLRGPAPGEEIYRRGHSGRRSKGLGLALCQQLAAEMGATLAHEVRPAADSDEPWIAFTLDFGPAEPSR